MILNVWFKPCPWVVFLNFVDFCRDSAIHASLIALAAPKVESLEAALPIRNSRLSYQFLQLMLQRYEEFLNYASFFAIIFPKIAKKYPSRGEWQFPRERAATSLHFISKQAAGALVILSLCYFLYSFMVRYPPFCPRNIQVFIYSTRTGRFLELGKLDEVKVYKLWVEII